MKNNAHSFIALVVMGLFFVTVPGHAARQVTAKQLIELDKLGAFPPDFKEAVRDYVNVQQTIADAHLAEKKTRDQIPALEQKVQQAQTKVDKLNEVLVDYNHTDETDFSALQAKMSDASAKPKDQLMSAQVFLWSYPASPHLTQAQAYLQQVQKQISDELQAEKDVEAAKAAALAALLQRVHDKNLSMSEWKSFLNNMAQDDVIKYLGSPPQKAGYYWVYPGEWAFDAEKNRKVGLQLNFNGGRVVGVTEYDTGPAPAAPTPASTEIN